MAVGCFAGCGNSAAKKDADKYYIGGIGPTTGGTAIYGTAVMNGAQIAVDEINEDGGINGKKIEFNFQDDQGDAEKYFKRLGYAGFDGNSNNNSLCCSCR